MVASEAFFACQFHARHSGKCYGFLVIVVKVCKCELVAASWVHWWWPGCCRGLLPICWQLVCVCQRPCLLVGALSKRVLKVLKQLPIPGSVCSKTIKKATVMLISLASSCVVFIFIVVAVMKSDPTHKLQTFRDHAFLNSKQSVGLLHNIDVFLEGLGAVWHGCVTVLSIGAHPSFAFVDCLCGVLCCLELEHYGLDVLNRAMGSPATDIVSLFSVLSRNALISTLHFP